MQSLMQGVAGVRVFEAVFFQLAVDGGLANAEEFGGAQAVASNGLESIQDGATFQVFKGMRLIRISFASQTAQQRRGQVFQFEQWPGTNETACCTQFSSSRTL